MGSWKIINISFSDLVELKDTMIAKHIVTQVEDKNSNFSISNESMTRTDSGWLWESFISQFLICSYILRKVFDQFDSTIGCYDRLFKTNAWFHSIGVVSR